LGISGHSPGSNGALVPIVLTCVDGRLRGHDGGRSVGVPSFSENELLSTPSRATLMPVGRREAPLPTLF
jgi:hypothetical protein